jgi:release factor glutamine methyltransferase
VALIVGFADFRGLRIAARPGTFIPRDSTEFLAEQAIRRLRRRPRPVAVDLATGSGPVALAIKNEVRRASVYGTDLSAKAVQAARANSRRLRLPVRFYRGDLYGALPSSLQGKVDVVTLHPPYVARSELRELPDEIRRFEPKGVLSDGTSSGLGLVQAAASQAGDWLRPFGWLLVEVSPDRARSVASVMRKAGLKDVRSTKDRSFQVTRVMVGRV